jgi:hypothetical protein
VSVDIIADTTTDLNVTLVALGGLVVKTEPSGASIVINNKTFGVTPFETAKLIPGEYTLKCEKQGFISFEKQFTVAEGKTDTIAAALQPVQPPAVPAAGKVEKKHFDHVGTLVATCIFALFAIIIIAVEVEDTTR